MNPIKHHAKENIHYILILAAMLIALTAPLLFFRAGPTGLAVFSENFNEGIHNNTTYDSGSLHLEGSDTGTYTSQVFEAEGNSHWLNISWTAYTTQEPAGGVEVTFEEVELDGIDDYILLPNSPYATDESGTVSVWMKYHGSNTSTFFYTGHSGTNKNYLKLGIKPNGKLLIEAKTDDVILKLKGTEALTEGELHHIIFGSDANGNKIYVDGSEHAVNYKKGDWSTHAWFGNLSEANATILGAYAGKQWEEYLNGTIGKVEVFDRMLTQEEAESLYKQGVLSLSLSARSCDDPECEGEEWVEVAGESPQELETPDNKYFQYKFYFHTEDISHTLEVYSVSISSLLLPEPITEGTATGNIVSTISNLSFTINGSKNIENYTGIREMKFYDGDTTLMAFKHNFSENDLNLSRITVSKAEAYIIFKTAGQIKTKAIYMENNAFDRLCLKDAEIDSIGDVSATCTEQDETDMTACLGNSNGITIMGYHCRQEGELIEVHNVTHSALKGTREEEPPAQTTSSGGRSARTSEGNTITRPETEEKDEEKTEQQPENKEEPTAEKQEKTYETVETHPQETHVQATFKKEQPLKSKSAIAATALLVFATISGLFLLRRPKL